MKGEVAFERFTRVFIEVRFEHFSLFLRGLHIIGIMNIQIFLIINVSSILTGLAVLYGTTTRSPGNLLLLSHKIFGRAGPSMLRVFLSASLF